ncbi:30S ribosomal protein S15 [Candidatus Tremblaya princeps]|uniref:Small ribosomal subunit protein uS15 n=2 Tax=Tremblaya princeps TaxID=189385 RepID=A0A1C3K960_TREPR|nr:30S ribosomal protein S15 [Candidatus Tremblaya princeps]
MLRSMPLHPVLASAEPALCGGSLRHGFFIAASPTYSSVAAYGGGVGNTGCSAVQVALMTERINRLRRGHFSMHARDRHGYRGLQCLISRRRRLLSYLRKRRLIMYAMVVNRLGLRR